MAAIALSLLSIFFGIGHHDYAPSEVNFAPLATTAPFMVLFGIFFPAVTGFEAGVSMSGDLKDPKKSLPYGAMLAVGVGFIVYIGLAFFYTFSVDSNALVNDPQILFKISLSPTLVIIGIWGATLSSAFGSILGAPRILQAIAQDKIVHSVFARGAGNANEPRNALLLAFLIAETGILIGELDVIARIVSMFFITTYAFLNLAAAIESWSSSDYRPAFKIPKFVSILGTLSAFIVMILLDFLALAAAILVLGLLYLYLRRKELILESGDAWSSFWTNLAKKSLLNLSLERGNTRNWRPNVLLFSRNEEAHKNLIEMGLALTGKLGALTDFNLINPQNPHSNISKIENQVGEVKKQNYFIREFQADSFANGIKTVSSVYGFSGFEPNTVMMSWDKNVHKTSFLVDIIKDLKTKNLNTIFLEYDKNNGFGKKQHIDIWWDGEGRFLSFALNILKFLSSDSSWRDAQARILVINSHTALQDSIIRNTNAIIKDMRLQAEVKVINDDFGSRTIEEIINSESSGADLLMIGISQNKNAYTTEYINYINRLAALPSSLLLLAPSDEFDEISLFENVQTKVKQEAFIGESIELKPLPSLENHIVSKRIEKLDVDCMKMGSDFVASTLNKIINVIRSMQLELKDFVIHNKTILNKELDDEGNHNPIKTISRNHQLYLRKIAYQVEQRHQGLLHEMKNDLKQGISELLSELNNYTRYTPETITIPLLTNGSEETEINFKYKKFIDHHINALVKPEITKQLLLLEEITINQMIKLRELLFGINDSYEKLLLSNEDNPDKSLEGLEDQIKGFDELENNLSQFADHTNSKLLQTFRNLSVTMAGEMIDPEHIGARKKVIKVKMDNHDEYLSSFAEQFVEGVKHMNNTLYLDAHVLSTKNLARNIIKSGNKKISNSITEKLLEPIEDFIKVTEKAVSETDAEFKSIQLPDNLEVRQIFIEAWNKITDIIDNFPEDIEIPEAIYNASGNLHFSDYNVLHINLKKSSNYYMDTIFYEPYYRELEQLEKIIQASITATREANSLLVFNINNQKNNNLKDVLNANTDNQIYIKLLQQISKVKDEVTDAIERMEHFSMVHLQSAFSKLFYHSIADSERNISSEQRELTGRKLTAGISKGIKNIKDSINNLIVFLINSSSSGMLKSRKYLGTKEKTYTQSSYLLELIEQLLPNQKTYNTVPVFYRKLMNSNAKIIDEFWIPREGEINKIKDGLNKHRRGFGGAILITGTHGAGKTAISRYAVTHLFKKKNIYWVDGPVGGSTSVEEFLKALQSTVNSQDDFIDLFNNMTNESTLVINDLELWWERRAGGDEVLQKIIELVQTFGQKIFFVLNCNNHSFNIIKKLVPIEENCLSIVECNPFNARELKQLILSRHKSSGIQFIYNDSPEESVSQLSLSLLFNSYFNATKGIPGVALNTWKSNILDTKDEAIVIKKPEHPSHELFLNLPSDWLIILSLFIQHKHMDVEKLVRISGYPIEEVKTLVLNLKNAGILVYKNEKVITIGRIVEPLIVDTCLYKRII
jgi:hypothetical protein